MKKHVIRDVKVHLVSIEVKVLQQMMEVRDLVLLIMKLAEKLPKC